MPQDGREKGRRRGEWKGRRELVAAALVVNFASGDDDDEGDVVVVECVLAGAVCNHVCVCVCGCV